MDAGPQGVAWGLPALPAEGWGWGTESERVVLSVQLRVERSDAQAF